MSTSDHDRPILQYASRENNGGSFLAHTTRNESLRCGIQRPYRAQPESLRPLEGDKRKRELGIEGFVSGFKPGKPEHGHAHLIGAVEFSLSNPDGSVTPIAWVSSWTDQERKEMTVSDTNGKMRLNSSYLGRRALLRGHDFSAKSGRVRHARFIKWLTAREGADPGNTKGGQLIQAT